MVEDADELLRADAKRETGQALSRLLNLGDGLIGQGLAVLVLITTNEPLGRLHPAVVRPGRCLAEVEFRPLSAAEAGAWLAGPESASSPATIAELYERRDQRHRLSRPPESRPEGLYL